ncbi:MULTISPECIES: hypothetical protein [unclassified Methylobacterium]|jgi:hypothetical protein|uniref:hypothetical protein n=1 Tax=unclassified Methylobacterium TaxID=2615210 RepID=UPI0013560974|nr:hypothetical protein [Methylobacterium sp. 2A]MWV22445.1 hypothetical protein [Methylobacterium sp. 2A]
MTMRTQFRRVDCVFMPGGSMVLEYVPLDELTEAFEVAVVRSGLSLASMPVVQAQADMVGYALICRDSQWGTVLTADAARDALARALRRLGLEPVAEPPRGGRVLQ